MARGSVCERVVLDGAQQRDPWASQVGRPRRRSWRKYDGEHRGGVGAYCGAWGSRVAVRWRVGAMACWCGVVQATMGKKTIAASSLAPATTNGSDAPSSFFPLLLPCGLGRRGCRLEAVVSSRGRSALVLHTAHDGVVIRGADSTSAGFERHSDSGAPLRFTYFLLLPPFLLPSLLLSACCGKAWFG